MNTALRRLASVAMVMCLALMGSATWVQVVQAGQLNSHPNNKRADWRRLGDARGAIVVGGNAVASSVPSDDEFGHQRQYGGGDPATAMTYASVTGFQSWYQSAGLEQYSDKYLRSDSDHLVFTRIRDILTGRQPEGATVETTIVPSVQEAALDALRCDKPSDTCLQGADGQYYLQGAIVAIEPSTGKILALVSTPSYDPNPLASHNVGDAIAAYNALDTAPGKPLRNKVYNERYFPGSTFKLITAAAALESGQYTPDSMLYGPRVLTLPHSNGTTMENYGGESCDPRGSDYVSLADSLRMSCNTSFAGLGMDLGADAVQAQAEKFGFNGAQGEVRIPMPAVQSVFPTGLDDPATARSSIGQGDVQATPLQMAMVSAAIANGGTMMRPYLVDTVQTADLSVISTTKPEQIGQPVSSRTAGQLTQMMELVVQSGSGTPAQIPGVKVAAKTGTAQDGNNSPHVWFTGFAPADHPQVAVAVFVKNGGSAGDEATGGKVAAPMAKQVIEAVLNS